jgi:hypothetical protein
MEEIRLSVLLVDRTRTYVVCDVATASGGRRC